MADVDRDKTGEPSSNVGGPSAPSLPDIIGPISPSDTPITVPLGPVSANISPTAPAIGPFSPGDRTGIGDGPDTGLYDPAALDAPPRAIVQVAPAYPFEAKSAGLAGQVVVEFMVDESGRVHNPRVVSASDAIFAEPTLRAVEHWRFSPGTRHGVPVRFRMAVPVSFNLN